MAGLDKSARGASAFAIGLLLSLGICLTGLGGYQLFKLDKSHQRSEILYSVSPGTLQVWLVTLNHNDPGDAARVANRLVNMTLPQRRDVVLAIARPEFFEQITDSFADRRRLQLLVLEALQLALAEAPALGELWFLSARLRGNLYGMDSAAQSYLELSFAYSPKEVDLVLERLKMMSLAWPLLNDRLREIVRHDVRVVELAYPGRAGELRQYLQKAGAVLDDAG